MSLADELLADLEDENDVEDVEIKEEHISDDEKSGEDEPMEFEEMKVDVKVDSIRSICKLRDSARLQDILAQIEKYRLKNRSTAEMIGNLESDPEYQLIVEANNIAVEIDNECCKSLLVAIFAIFFTLCLFSNHPQVCQR